MSKPRVHEAMVNVVGNDLKRVRITEEQKIFSGAVNGNGELKIDLPVILFST
jgi:flagella basal body P-ring formation protein FlgA